MQTNTFSSLEQREQVSTLNFASNDSYLNYMPSNNQTGGFQYPQAGVRNGLENQNYSNQLNNDGVSNQTNVQMMNSNQFNNGMFSPGNNSIGMTSSYAYNNNFSNYQQYSSNMYNPSVDSGSFNAFNGEFMNTLPGFHVGMTGNNSYINNSFIPDTYLDSRYYNSNCGGSFFSGVSPAAPTSTPISIAPMTVFPSFSSVGSLSQSTDIFVTALFNKAGDLFFEQNVNSVSSSSALYMAASHLSKPLPNVPIHITEKAHEFLSYLAVNPKAALQFLANHVRLHKEEIKHGLNGSSQGATLLSMSLLHDHFGPKNLEPPAASKRPSLLLGTVASINNSESAEVNSVAPTQLSAADYYKLRDNKKRVNKILNKFKETYLIKTPVVIMSKIDHNTKTANDIHSVIPDETIAAFNASDFPSTADLKARNGEKMRKKARLSTLESELKQTSNETIIIKSRKRAERDTNNGETKEPTPIFAKEIMGKFQASYINPPSKVSKIWRNFDKTERKI